MMRPWQRSGWRKDGQDYGCRKQGKCGSQPGLTHEPGSALWSMSSLQVNCSVSICPVKQLSVKAHTSNLSTRELKAGGWEFKTSLGYTKIYKTTLQTQTNQLPPSPLPQQKTSNHYHFKPRPMHSFSRCLKSPSSSGSVKFQ